MSVEAISVNKSVSNAEVSELGRTEPKTEPYPNDTVELSTKKEKKKSGLLKKTMIGITASFAATVGLACLIVKHQGNRIKKLYDEKLVIKNLKEHIDFTEAKTVEEGIKFAKEVLGIKNVASSFTLEAINSTNRGLVDVSNAHKGKVFMPHALVFTSPTKKNDYLAAVQMNINSPEFGNMYINKQYFDNKYLDEEIRTRLFDKSGKQLFEFNSNLEAELQPIWDNYVLANPKKDVAKLINDYYTNAAEFSIEQKRDLFYSLSYGKDNARRAFRTPIETIKSIEQSQKEFLDTNNIVINYDELAKKSYKEQKKELKSLLDKMKADNRYLIKNFDLFSPLKTIYHEMGHLQDAAKNLKELDLKQWKFDWKGEWRSIRNKRKTGEITSRADVNEVDNRWGTVWDKGMKRLYVDMPKKFKKKYPDLYEFLQDSNIQQTAGKISAYSQTGIGEFIAETYARMINGQKIPDDVMSLYRKYKGPELP